jgi:hypothetical protein
VCEHVHPFPHLAIFLGPSSRSGHGSGALRDEAAMGVRRESRGPPHRSWAWRRAVPLQPYVVPVGRAVGVDQQLIAACLFVVVVGTPLGAQSSWKRGQGMAST